MFDTVAVVVAADAVADVAFVKGLIMEVMVGDVVTRITKARVNAMNGVRLAGTAAAVKSLTFEFLLRPTLSFARSTYSGNHNVI